MNKYDVLANLDIDSIGNNSVKSWIDALSDGEYLSNYDYSETIVNDAVSILESLNKTTFTVCDQSGVDIIARDFISTVARMARTESNELLFDLKFTIAGTTVAFYTGIDAQELIHFLGMIENGALWRIYHEL